MMINAVLHGCYTDGTSFSLILSDMIRDDSRDSPCLVSQPSQVTSPGQFPEQELS